MVGLFTLYTAVCAMAAVDQRRYELDPTAVAIPIGLVTGVLCLVAGTWWWRLAVVIPLITTGGLFAGGLDPGLAVLWGLSTGVGSAAGSHWLRRAATERRPSLHNARDLLDYLAASLLAGLSVALPMAVFSPTLIDTPALEAAAHALASGTLSSMVFLPLFMAVVEVRPVAGPAERVLQWTLLLGYTTAVFVTERHVPELGYVVLCLLVWGALRGHINDTRWQILVVTMIATGATHAGVGLLSLAAQASASGPFDAAIAQGGLRFFTIACVLSALPFAVAVASERQASRREVASAQTMQRVIDAAVGVAIVGTDARGSITIFNPGAERMLGYSREEVLGASPLMFHPPRELDRVAERFGQEPDYLALVHRLTQPDAASTEIVFRRKDGEERIHALTLSPVHDPNGELSGFVSTAEDVTERVRTTQALEYALARQQEIDRTKDAFVSNVSHELRTPITSILGYLEMLEEGGFGELGPDQAGAVARVSNNSRRLLELIDDLLILSALEQRAFAGTVESIDLREVVRAGWEVAAPADRGVGPECRLELPPEPVHMRGDSTQLERVVTNLVANALKFTREGWVTTSLATVGDHAVITVQDTGLGIPTEEQDHLFDRFFRSSVSQREEIRGSGLGLPIALGIVEMHDGRIEVESRVGEGSTFRVLLPLHQTEDDDPGPETADAPGLSPEASEPVG